MWSLSNVPWSTIRYSPVSVFSESTLTRGHMTEESIIAENLFLIVPADVGDFSNW